MLKDENTHSCGIIPGDFDEIHQMDLFKMIRKGLDLENASRSNSRRHLIDI